MDSTARIAALVVGCILALAGAALALLPLLRPDAGSMVPGPWYAPLILCGIGLALAFPEWLASTAKLASKLWKRRKK